MPPKPFRKRVPPSAVDNPRRVQERAYEEEWARSPAGEAHRNVEPGAGPLGTVNSPWRNRAAQVLWVGLAVCVLSFFLASGAVFGAGAALVLVGTVWAVVRNRRPRALRGDPVPADDLRRRAELEAPPLD